MVSVTRKLTDLKELNSLIPNIKDWLDKSTEKPSVISFYIGACFKKSTFVNSSAIIILDTGDKNVSSIITRLYTLQSLNTDVILYVERKFISATRRVLFTKLPIIPISNDGCKIESLYGNWGN